MKNNTRLKIAHGPRGVPRRSVSMTLPAREHDALIVHAHAHGCPISVLVRSCADHPPRPIPPSRSSAKNAWAVC